MSIILKLGKYVIPYFHVSVAVTANSTAWLTTAILLAAIIIDLRTWTARTSAMLPEVILLTKTEDAFCRNADLLIPDVKRLIII